MKQLQNNFTTPEQSKRLLKLGVPRHTADCNFQHAYNCDTGLYYYDLDEPKIGKPETKYDIPCWSVGRLIEIYELCSGHGFSRIKDRHFGDIVYNSVLDDILFQINHTIVNSVDGLNWDFSKLKD